VSPLLVLSTTIALLNNIYYCIAIIKGRIKPHRTTRFVFVIIALTLTFSLFAQHNTTAIYLTGTFAIGCIVSFILSIKYGIGGWTKIDILCLILALLGICLWISTNNPTLALYASIIADFAGVVPTIIKTFHHPNTEYWFTYFIDTIAGILNIFANKTYSLNAIVFPLYIIFINIIIILIIYKSAYRRIFRNLRFHML